jgi:hypothetical protein
MKKGTQTRQRKIRFWFFGVGTWDKVYYAPDFYTALGMFRWDYAHRFSGRRVKSLNDGLKYQINLTTHKEPIIMEAMVLLDEKEY